MRRSRRSYLALVTLLAVADASFEDDAEIQVSMNKAWPYSNPTETYEYYDFPFCKPKIVMPHFMTLGQVLRGDRLVNSLYPMHMKRQVPRTVICSRRMSEADIRMLKEAIDQNYMFELFVGELPIDRPFGVVSTMGNEKDEQVTDRYFLVNYLDFIIGYNEKEVVSANVTRELNLEHLVDITEWKEGMVIQFSYSVQWTPLPHILPSQALELQLKSTMPHGHQNMDIHWLAIINSFVLMLLILSLFLLIIIRVVRSDLSRYLQIPDEELNAVEEETGWKLLHADVFRAPKHRLFFCSAIGAGAQMTSMMIMVVLVGCIGAYYQRGAVASAAVISYMVTALLGGFVSANLYQKLGGEKWAWNIFMTALCFMGPAFLIWSFLNTVAIFYGSTAAFPFPTILLMFAMWACVTFPLTVLGGIIGRHRSLKQAQAEGSPFPCKTNKLAREIPSCRWYQSPVTQFFASGFLPFSAIYIELHYIFNSVWGPRIYFLYGILLLAFTMLLLVAGTVTVLFTYFHLNAEDLELSSDGQAMRGLDHSGIVLAVERLTHNVLRAVFDVVANANAEEECHKAGRQIQLGARLPAAILLTEPCHSLIQEDGDFNAAIDRQHRLTLVSRNFRRIARLFAALDNVHRLNKVGRTATQRELFYRVVSEGSGLFSSQQIMDRAMRDAVGALRIGRPHLGVLTTEKGLLAGEISFSHDNCLSVAAQGATGTCIGESLLDHRTRFHVGERAQIVLVVEKDTVFQHLLQSKLFTALPLILVTGRGYPDILTRRFLQKLHRVAPRLMQVYLGDFDPDGVAIYLVYRRSCNHLRWLGMHEPDVSKLPSGACLPLSKRDTALQQSLLRRSDVQHVRGLAEQVQSMTCKAELEALHAAYADDGMALDYIAVKIRERAWI
ncbi:TMN4 [Symbiodinium sp. CCMP2592]|nr:TMN4 [Symbiodinium sp. CCMP2592]